MRPHGQSDRNSSVFFKGDGCDPKRPQAFLSLNDTIQRSIRKLFVVKSKYLFQT